MISEPPEVSSAYALLEIISDPTRAKNLLDELVVEKNKALDALENARNAQQDATRHRAMSDETAGRVLSEAKDHRAKSESALAEAKKISDEHETRTKSMDERHEFLVAKDKRLTEYEATVAAREKPLADRDKAASDREAALGEREASLLALEKTALDMKEAYERKLAALKEAMGG